LDGSFREAAGFGWIVTEDDKTDGPLLSHRARAGHIGVGPGQGRNCSQHPKHGSHATYEAGGKTIDLMIWVKGHDGAPGNKKADVLAGRAAEKPGHSKVMSIAHLKLRISEKFREAKATWHESPNHHGTEEI
jgi:hypothetical protein